MATAPDSGKSGPTQRLLARAHPPQAAARIFAEKIHNRPLHLTPTAKTETEIKEARDARESRRRRRQALIDQKKRKPKPLSAREKRKLGVYDIPQAEKKYELYLGLHELWCDYIREVLDFPKKPEQHAPEEQRRVYQQALQKFGVQPAFAGPRIASADFHGALLSVVRSRCTSHVSLEGIVVKDTKFTFEIVTKKDQTKIIPKEHAVFQLQIPMERTLAGLDNQPLPPLSFELYGSQLISRAADRATKKFKIHIPDDL